MANKKNIPAIPLKRGRPDHYDPSMCKKAILLLREGYSKTELAAALDLPNRETINEYAEKYQDFGDALKVGLMYSEAWWMGKGRENILNKEFNSTLWYMNMKNRFGWKDKVENNTTVTIKQEDALKDLE
jgi:hypothetical protein